MKQRTITGRLVHGLRVGDNTHHDFTLREADTGDVLDAEQFADVGKPLNFAAGLMACQLQSVGTYNGPFTASMIRTLHRQDFRILMEAQRSLDEQGEAEQPERETI